MRQRKGAAALLIVLVGLLVFPAASPAVKQWKALKDGVGGGVDIANTNEIGLERGSDGVVHVLWVNNRTDGTQALLHTAVSGPDTYGNLDVAKPTALTTVSSAAGEGFNDRVDLVPAPGGDMRALFSATIPGSPFDGILATSTSTDDGTTWSAAAAASATAVTERSPVYAASGIGGAMDPDGTPTGAWGDSSPTGGGYRVGLTTDGADSHFDAACCEIDPGVAFDSESGKGYVAANVQDTGIQITPLGGGATTSAPESAHAWTLQRTSITGRISADGVYVGYGTGDNMFNARPAIWRVGDVKPLVLKKQEDAANVGIAPAPDGRLWIYWERDGTIFASRTNPSVTKFGAIVKRNAPHPGDTIYRLAGEGSFGSLDLFVLSGSANGSPNWWVRPLEAGLTMETLGNGKVAPGERIKFLLTDAGDPVDDAGVYAFVDGNEVHAPADAKGIVRLKIPKDARPAKERAFGGSPDHESAMAFFRITD